MVYLLQLHINPFSEWHLAGGIRVLWTLFLITIYNTAVTDAASEILGKERCKKKPWVTRDVLDLSDERRNLKKKHYEAEGAKEYREANEDSEGSEESKGGLDRCSVPGD